METRRRYLETMQFGQPDRTFLLPPWLWASTVERWHSEGLPADVHVDAYFDTDRYQVAPITVGLLPPTEREVLKEEGATRLVRRGGEGQLIREYHDRPDMNMPQWLDYPLKTREDWEWAFKPRLDPSSPGRYPLWWDDYVRRVKDRDYPLGISAGSFFGWVRDWMGVERLAYTLYDDPMLIHEIVDTIATCVCETIHPALDAVQFDFALIWEDMAGKGGPLCSPKSFREFQLPAYRRVTDLLHRHGVHIILIDSDGLNDPIIPCWLDAGVTGLYPLEVAAGEDAVQLRRRYGKQLMLYGNIDKRALARGPAAIEAEVLAKVPWLVLQGGYAPWIDHLVPPDVSFANFSYYMDLLHRIVADPERALFEAVQRGYWSE
jgi:uroporphyrinogen decarboxylase